MRNLQVWIDIPLADESREVARLLGGISNGIAIILRAGLDALYAEKPWLLLAKKR